MMYTGEIISLAVAVSWTATALFADVASHKIGALPLNVIRMTMSLVLLGLTLLVFTGSPVPFHADGTVWFWLSLSGLVGYVFGDFFLFNSYMVIGSRFGQLFMTLAPPVAAFLSWVSLGETLSWTSLIAMFITLFGIGMSVLVRGGEKGGITLKLPAKGVLFAILAAIGQGGGLVLSKIGMNHYETLIPEGAGTTYDILLPFASTLIRAITGLAGFLCIMAIQKGFGQLRSALKDGKAMAFAGGATFTGPFIGVSLSLMAVQYTSAGIASTIMALVPALIILPYALIFKQKVTFRECLGTIISLIGTALFFI